MVVTEFRFDRGQWVRLPDTHIEIRMFVEPVDAFGEVHQVCRRSIGRLLAEHRLALGMSQATLADRLCQYQPTVTRHEVSRWERGERVPRGVWLDRLGAELRLSGPAREVIDWSHSQPAVAVPRLRLAVNDPAQVTAAATLPLRWWTPVPGCAWRVRPINVSRGAGDRRDARTTNTTRSPERSS